MQDDAGTIDMSAFRVHLADGPVAQALPITPDFWERVGRDAALSDGRMVGVHDVRDPDALHPSEWEMHPEGDELLYLGSGRIDLVLDDGAGERTVTLRKGSAFIVPPGVWHRLLLREPSLLVAITRGRGTQLRPA